MLATKEGSAVLRQVQARLRSDLGENYLLNVLNNVRSQASTLTLTADGGVMLDSAYDALVAGTSAMAEGLEQTASGTGALAESVGAIASGVTAVGAGAESLAAGMDATNDQVIAPLAAGAEATAAGVAAGRALKRSAPRSRVRARAFSRLRPSLIRAFPTLPG